jgi:hypothetical protein
MFRLFLFRVLLVGGFLGVVLLIVLRAALVHVSFK